MAVSLDSLPFWQQQAFTERADLWKRDPAASNAGYSLAGSAVPCYHFPRSATANDVEQFGQLPSVLYEWVFAETEAVPEEAVVTLAGAAYQGLAAPARWPSVAGGEGGHIRLLTHIVKPPPKGVTA